MYFKGNIHQTIFENAVNRLPQAPSDRMAAALYLLTADHSVWRSVQNSIDNNHIFFEKIKLTNVSAGGYVLYKTARELYLKEPQITVSVLADRSLISDRIWRLIQTAISIRRIGIQNAAEG